MVNERQLDLSISAEAAPERPVEFNDEEEFQLIVENAEIARRKPGKFEVEPGNVLVERVRRSEHHNRLKPITVGPKNYHIRLLYLSIINPFLCRRANFNPRVAVFS